MYEVSDIPGRLAGARSRPCRHQRAANLRRPTTGVVATKGASSSTTTWVLRSPPPPPPPPPAPRRRASRIETRRRQAVRRRVRRRQCFARRRPARRVPPDCGSSTASSDSGADRHARWPSPVTFGVSPTTLRSPNASPSSRFAAETRYFVTTTRETAAKCIK